METGVGRLTVLNLTLVEIYTLLIMNIMPFFALDILTVSGRHWYVIQGCYGRYISIRANDGYLYVTANQLHRQARFNKGKDLRVRPYTLFRILIDAQPVFITLIFGHINNDLDDTVGRTTNISNLFMHRCNLARQHYKDPGYRTAINRKNKFIDPYLGCLYHLGLMII